MRSSLAQRSLHRRTAKAGALLAAGGRSTVIGVDDQSPATPKRLAATITRDQR